MSQPEPGARPPGTDIATETAAADYQDLDTWSTRNILAALVESNRRAVEAVGRAATELERAADGIEERLSEGGRLIYVGAGTSGRLGMQDAAELPPTFGFDRAEALLAGGLAAQSQAAEGAEDDVEAAARDVAALRVGAADAVVGVAASGVTPYTVAAVAEARRRGAFTVGMANSPGTPLLTVGHVGVLLESGPEVLAGSTRLAAGTAQKVALNALSTSVLVRLGGAYGNLMVGMRPVNAKLRTRAAGIVARAAVVTPDLAAQALSDAGDDIRVAIVLARTGVSVAAARAALAGSAGNVRKALASLASENEPGA